jgi:hypothetical protein
MLPVRVVATNAIGDGAEVGVGVCVGVGVLVGFTVAVGVGVGAGIVGVGVADFPPLKFKESIAKSEVAPLELVRLNTTDVIFAPELSITPM